jgi:hypothetical protein
MFITGRQACHEAKGSASQVLTTILTKAGVECPFLARRFS